MKTNLFLNLIFLTTSVLIQNTARASQAGSPLDFWVQDEQNEVYFAPKPEVVVNYSHIGADPMYWDQLNIKLDYDHNPSYANEVTALQKMYPNYTLKRADVSQNAGFTLSIPSMGKSDPMDVHLSPNGPWFDATYFVTQDQSAAVAAALQNDPAAITITGNIQVSVPVESVVERVELGTDVCDQLGAGPSDLYSTMTRYTQISKRLDEMNFKYGSTKDALQRSLLDTCLELNNPTQPVNSFKALMTVQVVEKSAPTRPFGETRQPVQSQISIPVKYDLIKTIQGAQS